MDWEIVSYGLVRQGDEGPAEAHAACTRVGEAELEGDDRLLGRDAGRRQQPGKK